MTINIPLISHWPFEMSGILLVANIDLFNMLVMMQILSYSDKRHKLGQDVPRILFLTLFLFLAFMFSSGFQSPVL